VLVGKRRRAELKEPPAKFTDDASGRLARAICDAAAKARGEIE
jgi:hypothetical protein